MATSAEMPRSPGTFVLRSVAGFAPGSRVRRVRGGGCASRYAPRMGAPSLPPGRYFHMHMIGYFDGIDSKRGIAWRCADSFSLRDFLRLSRSVARGRDSLCPRSGRRAPPRTERRFPIIRGCRARGRVCRTTSAARGARAGVRLGLEAFGRARAGEGRADRRRWVDDGGQRRAGHDRAARQRRELPRDADAGGGGERRRGADRRGPGALRPQTQGQDAVKRRLEEPDRPGCPDRQS
jgi:hypothetical protein